MIDRRQLVIGGLAGLIAPAMAARAARRGPPGGGTAPAAGGGNAAAGGAQNLPGGQSGELGSRLGGSARAITPAAGADARPADAASRRGSAR